MAETPSEPTIDPGLRDYLDAELRQAEVDFASLPRPAARRTLGVAPLATLLAAAVVLLVVVVAGTQFLGRSNLGPAAIQLGADGLPTAINGEPVLRGDAIAKRAVTAGSFLAGGTLALASDPCFMQAAPSAALCIESWKLVNPDGDASVFLLSGVASAPGFVHTSGALTVVRVSALSGSTADPSALGVEAVVWRHPTKGPVPPEAAPPQGGSEYDALVPDFVATWGQDGISIVGYVSKSELNAAGQNLPGSPSNPPQALPVPVYGEDLTTLVGHMVPGIGFVRLGATAPPASSDALVVPSPVGSQAIGPVGPTLDCGRIAATPCEQAVSLALNSNVAAVGNASFVVVDDVCAPSVACDRLYPFDAIVVFVTAGADTTGWYAFEVTGLEDSTPTKAEPWLGEIPAHIVQRLTAATQPTPSTPAPSASSAPASGPTLECGNNGVQFRASVLDGEPLLTGPDNAIAAHRAFLAAGGYPGMPSDGWRTVVANEGSVTFLSRGTPGWWYVTVAADTGGGWRDSEYGECRLEVRLPTTMTYAEWRLDPKHPVSTGATTVTVLATELACASGKPPGSRLQTPVVVETDASVTITLLVRKQGSADCPSNPEFRVVVALKAPLGSRSLLDASTYPATER